MKTHVIELPKHRLPFNMANWLETCRKGRINNEESAILAGASDGGFFVMSRNAERIALITRRLYDEYVGICYQYRVELVRPVIQIRHAESFHGKWDPETRTISLSQTLVDSYPWQVVLEVLKHEMAHQMVTDLYRQTEGHGPFFQQAAHRLALPDWARRASSEIPRAWEAALEQKGTSTPEREKWARVEKLLALAGSSNRHEAELAMQRAFEISTKYNLSESVSSQDNEGFSLAVHHGKKRVERYQSMLASLLNDFYFVRIIYVPIFDNVACRECKGFEILGTRQNVLFADYVYRFLNHAVLQLWKQYGREHPAHRTARARYSFLTGAALGFRQKLETLQTQIVDDHPTGVALIRALDGKLDAYVAQRFPRLTTVARTRTRIQTSHFEAGRERGKNITLHRPVNSGATHSGKRLR